MKKAGDLLGAYLDSNMAKKAHGYSTLFNSWKQIVGEQLAAHSHIAELEKGILIIEAEHPSWIQLLQFQQKEFLEKAKRNFPSLSISGIAFKLQKEGGTVCIPNVDVRVEVEVPADVSNDLSDQEPEKNPFDQIKDDSFREQLIRLEKAIKASKRRP